MPAFAATASETFLPSDERIVDSSASTEERVCSSSY